MNEILKKRALKLRRNSSQAEITMWSILRNRRLNKFKFRRQYVIEPYIADFVCLKKKLIIELDGDHHEFQKEYDARRTVFLESHGYKVLRFTNSMLFNSDGEIELSILKALMN